MIGMTCDSLLFQQMILTGFKNCIAFTVPGAPQGKGRPRFTRFGKAYTPAKTRAYEARVKAAALAMLKRQQMPLEPAGEDPVMVVMQARYALPKRITKADKYARLAGLKAPGKPDTDNISKVKDALNKVIWHDDKQVTAEIITKSYTEDEPGLDIYVAWGRVTLEEMHANMVNLSKELR